MLLENKIDNSAVKDESAGHESGAAGQGVLREDLARGQVPQPQVLRKSEVRYQSKQRYSLLVISH